MKGQNKFANKKIFILAAALSHISASGLTIPPAFAHAHTSLNVASDDISGRKIDAVLGHANEPTYGALPGIHDGKHVLRSFSVTIQPSFRLQAPT